MNAAPDRINAELLTSVARRRAIRFNASKIVIARLVFFLAVAVATRAADNPGIIKGTDQFEFVYHDFGSVKADRASSRDAG